MKIFQNSESWPSSDTSFSANKPDGIKVNYPEFDKAQYNLISNVISAWQIRCREELHPLASAPIKALKAADRETYNRFHDIYNMAWEAAARNQERVILAYALQELPQEDRELMNKIAGRDIKSCDIPYMPKWAWSIAQWVSDVGPSLRTSR